MSAALVLVDLQHDFLRAPGLEPAANDVVRACAALLADARRRGFPVFHVRTTVRRGDDNRMPHWRRAGKRICVEGTEGHLSPPALAPAAGEPVFDKTFFSAFTAPGFEAALREAAPATVVLAGVHLHACVRATALDLYARGYDVRVADDGVASDDPPHAAATRRWLGARGASFVAGLDVGPEAADVEAGVAAAEASFATWRATPASARAALLERVAAAVEQRTDEWAARMARDLGKPVRFGAAEVARAAALLRAAAAQAADEPGRPCGPGARARRVPHGVVALVTPWNNPVAIPLGKIGPALAFGNTVAWKPAPAAAGIARDVAALLAPVVQVVSGGAAAARALMDDARVRAITLTGSAAAGHAAQECAARRHVPLQAELGGNNGAIVWRDADLVRAAELVAAGAFEQAGQRCTANRRVVVDASCADAFLEELAKATAALVVGDPLDPATRVGPLVSANARARVEAALDEARAAGCTVVTPHGDVPGACVAPSIVVCDDACHPIVTEELFGPVLVVQRADGFDHALALLNGVRQGLAAALFSPAEERRARFLAEADAGILKLDESTAGAGVEAPFGGWKASGTGPPEHGPGNVEFYTRWQAVYGAS